MYLMECLEKLHLECADCLTNYGTPMFVTNNAQVNLITELQLEYRTETI